MANGGKRPGAGRKKGYKSPGTLERLKGIAYIQKRVEEELEPIITKAIEQAKAGDVASRKDLMDRAYGKPKETVELTGVKRLLVDL